MTPESDPFRVCEYCGRRAAGPDRCPHAMDGRLACPHRKKRRIGNNPYFKEI
jgi:hypothetical protein